MDLQRILLFGAIALQTHLVLECEKLVLHVGTAVASPGFELDEVLLQTVAP